MSNISKEIMDRIIAEANNQYNDEVIESTHDFIKGATYQLATDGREELEKENERLKDLLYNEYYKRRQDAGIQKSQIEKVWEQFIIENKI